MYWDQLSSPQIAQLEKSIPVILPVSATEQHGPHLPLSTDRLIGEYFLDQLNNQMSDLILILPSIPVGCSEHHLDFPGSMSVRHKTLLRTLIDQANSVVHHGFINLVLFNSHGGNQAVGQTFVETFGYRNPQCKVVMLTWWRIANEALRKISDTGPGGTGHAGEFETSLMMVIAPHLVNTEVIPAKQNRPNLTWANGDLLSGPSASFYRSMKQLTPSGAFGEPRKASAEKGKRISEAVVSAVKEVILDISHS